MLVRWGWGPGHASSGARGWVWVRVTRGLCAQRGWGVRNTKGLHARRCSEILEMRGPWAQWGWGLRARSGSGSEPRVGCVAGRAGGASTRWGWAWGAAARLRATCGLGAEGLGISLLPLTRSTPQHPGLGEGVPPEGKSPFLPPGSPVQLISSLKPPPHCKSFAFTIPPLAHYYTNFMCLGLLAAIKLAQFPGGMPAWQAGCEEEEEEAGHRLPWSPPDR